MITGDRVALTPDEQRRVDTLDKKQLDEQQILHQRQRAEREEIWQEIRASHPELDGCVLTYHEGLLYVLRTPTAP